MRPNGVGISERSRSNGSTSNGSCCAAIGCDINVTIVKAKDTTRPTVIMLRATGCRWAAQPASYESGPANQCVGIATMVTFAGSFDTTRSGKLVLLQVS